MQTLYFCKLKIPFWTGEPKPNVARMFREPIFVSWENKCLSVVRIFIITFFVISYATLALPLFIPFFILECKRVLRSTVHMKLMTNLTSMLSQQWVFYCLWCWHKTTNPKSIHPFSIYLIVQTRTWSLPQRTRNTRRGTPWLGCQFIVHGTIA